MGEMAGGEHCRRLHGLSFRPIDSAQDIRTVNRLERVNKEIRRRTRVLGIFPNEDSVLRLTSAVLAEIYEEWLTGRQYLNLVNWSTTEKPASQLNYKKISCVIRDLVRNGA